MPRAWVHLTLGSQLCGTPSTLTTPGQALGFPTQRDSGEPGEGRGRKEREGGGGEPGSRGAEEVVVPAESVVWEVARHEEVSMAGVTRAVPGEGGH